MDQTSAAGYPIAAPPLGGRQVHGPTLAKGALAESPPFWGVDGFTFDDLLDLINPLQHIPLLGSLYRAWTGDEIAFGPRVLGGALFAGGPVGAAVAVAVGAADGMVEYRTGHDIGGHVLAWVGLGEEIEAPAEVEVAGLPWLIAPEPAAPAAEAAPAPRLEVAEAPRAEEPVPQLTPAQWRALTGSLDAAPAAPAAPPDAAPAQVAAAMSRALDKYQALTRARASASLVE